MTRTVMEEVQKRFDKAASQWDADPGRIALAKGVVAAIREAVPLSPDMTVLDFGAGTGLVTLGLSSFTGRLTALDASQEMLRVLEGKLKALGVANVQTLWCDITKTPLAAAQFDLVVSSMALHHIPDVPQTLRLLRPALRAGGWIALADLDAEDGTFHTDATGVYHQGFDREAVRRWLQASGFSGVAAREAHRIVRSSDNGRTREYPVFLVTGRAA